jgi:hypothetical protein
MKKFKKTSIAISVIGLLLCISCGSTTKISENNAPFKVLSATYSEWLGGQPGVNGVTISIKTDNSSIKLDSVYFRNTSALLKLNETTGVYYASIVLPNTVKNLQLHIDPKKEFGNEAPDISKNIPFELDLDEAVVSYFYKGKTNYYKILNLMEVKRNNIK